MAQICALDLLRALCQRGDSVESIACIAYASPAIGNQALAAGVQRMGWDGHFINYSLPGKTPVERTVLSSFAPCCVMGHLPASCGAAIMMRAFQVM